MIEYERTETGTFVYYKCDGCGEEFDAEDLRDYYGEAWCPGCIEKDMQNYKIRCDHCDEDGSNEPLYDDNGHIICAACFMKSLGGVNA